MKTQQLMNKMLRKPIFILIYRKISELLITSTLFKLIIIILNSDYNLQVLFYAILTKINLIYLVFIMTNGERIIKMEYILL